MAHHNYPTTRKCRDTSYAKSTQLLNKVGADKFKEIFSRVGMCKCGQELSIELGEEVSPYTCRYIRRYKLNEKEDNL